MNSEEHPVPHPRIALDPAAAASQVETERCPWCDSVISRSKFLQIRTKIAEQERKKLGEERMRIEQELRREKKVFQARIKEEAYSALALVAAERDQAATKLKELEAREVIVRQQTAVEAEARVRAEVAEKLAAMSSESDEVAAKLKELEESRSQHQQELAQQRSVLEQDRDCQVSKLATQHAHKLEILQDKVDALTRQLQHKAANELAEGAEIDVYEALRDSFVGDDITRIKKGQPGADIRHKVIYKGAECGAIVIDSKKRHGWQNAYVTKLWEDQVADRADHAILATSVFPAGKKELYIDQETGVIVVSRARTVEVTGLLRNAMIRMHCLGLSLEQRTEKRDLLYKYLTSEEYRLHIREANLLICELGELETEEKNAHDKIWKKRGLMTTQLRNALRHTDTEVNAILESKSSAPVEEEPST